MWKSVAFGVQRDPPKTNLLLDTFGIPTRWWIHVHEFICMSMRGPAWPSLGCFQPASILGVCHQHMVWWRLVVRLRALSTPRLQLRRVWGGSHCWPALQVSTVPSVQLVWQLLPSKDSATWELRGLFQRLPVHHFSSQGKGQDLPWQDREERENFVCSAFWLDSMGWEGCRSRSLDGSCYGLNVGPSVWCTCHGLQSCLWMSDAIPRPRSDHVWRESGTGMAMCLAQGQGKGQEGQKEKGLAGPCGAGSWWIWTESGPLTWTPACKWGGHQRTSGDSRRWFVSSRPGAHQLNSDPVGHTQKRMPPGCSQRWRNGLEPARSPPSHTLPGEFACTRAWWARRKHIESTWLIILGREYERIMEKRFQRRIETSSQVQQFVESVASWTFGHELWQLWVVWDHDMGDVWWHGLFEGE